MRELDRPCSCGTSVRTLLASYHGAARARRNLQPPTTSESTEEPCVFQLESMDLVLHRMELTRPECSQFGATLASRAVPLRGFVMHQEDSSFIMEPVLGALAGPSHSPGGLDMEIKFDRCDENAFVAIFSALAISSSVKSLELIMCEIEGVPTPPHRLLWLQWITFACWSRFSRCSVERLSIQHSFDAHDADAIAEILDSCNPLAILRGSQEPRCRTMVLKEEMTLVMSDTGCTVHVSTGTIVWVVHDRGFNETIDILVPGFGVQAIARHKIGHEAFGCPPCISFLKLRNAVEYEAFAGLKNLLGVVGAPLKRLEIFHTEMEHEDLRPSECIGVQYGRRGYERSGDSLLRSHVRGFVSDVSTTSRASRQLAPTEAPNNHHRGDARNAGGQPHVRVLRCCCVDRTRACG